MKKYDTYKDSGIEWIGEVPSHWETKRIRHIADIFGRIGYRGYTVEDIVFDETGAISLSPSNIENQKLTLESVTRITKEKYEESPEIMVYENDVVLVKTASVGKAAIVRPLNDLATINPQLVVFKNYRIDQTFFYYEIISRIIQNQITQDLNGGVVNTITQTNLNNYSIIVPSPKEQTAIANYLDRKTAEIDELIADKKRLLELYEEEKTAIINQAVTKGINLDAPMKDSGIEWLGEIPKHWEVKRLSWCFEIIGSGTTPKAGSEEYYLNGEFNWLLTGDLSDGDILETSKKITQKALDDNSSLKMYPVNSIVMAMYGATIGKLGVLKIQTTVNQACCVMGNPIHLNYQFAFFLLLAARKEIINMSYGGGQPNISQELIKSFRVQVPPIEEQQSIVSHIENECTLIDAKKAKTATLIELLTEYRTALISEVVTGKIKVTE